MSQKVSFLAYFWPILYSRIKTVKYLMHFIALHYQSKSQTSFTKFPGFMVQKTVQKQPKIGLQFQLIWGVTSYEITKHGINLTLNIYFTYGFFLFLVSYFFWHWHSFAPHNPSTKSFLQAQKPCHTGSVISIFNNIEMIIKLEYSNI